MSITNTPIKRFGTFNLQKTAETIKVLLDIMEQFSANELSEIKAVITGIVEINNNDDEQDFRTQLYNLYSSMATETEVDKKLDELDTVLGREVSSVSDRLTTEINNRIAAGQMMSDNISANTQNITTLSGRTTTIANLIGDGVPTIDGDAQSTFAAALTALETTMQDIRANSIIDLMDDDNYTIGMQSTYLRIRPLDNSWRDGLYLLTIPTSNISTIAFAYPDTVDGVMTSIDGDFRNGNTYIFKLKTNAGGSASNKSAETIAVIPQEANGQHWYSGTEFTHTYGSVDSALAGVTGEMYLNINTLQVYRCNGASANNASTYEWQYIGKWFNPNGIKASDLDASLQNRLSSIEANIIALQAAQSGMGGSTAQNTFYTSNVAATLDDPSMDGVTSKTDLEMKGYVESFYIQGATLDRSISVPTASFDITAPDYDEWDLAQTYALYDTISYNTTTREVTHSFKAVPGGDTISSLGAYRATATGYEFELKIGWFAPRGASSGNLEWLCRGCNNVFTFG